MDLFESARLRVDRAQARAKEMSEAWNAYLEPHPFEFLLLRTSPTEYVVRLEQAEPVPLELSALFGEWLYNLRSALDYTVWAAAAHSSGVMPPPNEEGLQYPIYDTEAAWKKNLWRLRPLAAHQVDMLHSMQPFNSDPDANYLGWINRLARIDRHRRLAIWTARVAEAEPVFKVPSGVTPKLEWGQWVFAGARCDLARLTFPTAETADDVAFNPRVGIDPEIAEWGESDFWRRTRFPERVKLLMVFVRAEIDVYDYDCTGAPAARRTVTDHFAAESDQRRTSRLFPTVQYPEPQTPIWTSAAPARRSSQDRFAGRDFPAHGTGTASPRRAEKRPLT